MLPFLPNRFLNNQSEPFMTLKIGSKIVSVFTIFIYLYIYFTIFFKILMSVILYLLLDNYEK